MFPLLKFNYLNVLQIAYLYVALETNITRTNGRRGKSNVVTIRREAKAVRSSAPIPQRYTFSTRIKHERKVNDIFKSASMESFRPLKRTRDTWKDRKKWVESPLFPANIFTKIPFNQRYSVLHIPSVINIVGFNNNPSPVKSDEIKAFKSLFTFDLMCDAISGLSSGSCVKVRSGPFEDMEALVTRLRGNKRLFVNVSVLGKSIANDATDYEKHKI